MNKRILLNLALLALIGLLVLLVVYEPGIEAPAEQPALININKEAIQQITIHREGQGSIELQRNDQGEWWMERPIHHAAEAFRIDSMLRIAEIKSLGSFKAEEHKLVNYDLAQPDVTLTLNNSLSLAFGSSTPLDQRRYVLLNDTVHLISDTLYYHLIGTFTTFLRKQLLPDGADIQSLHLPDLTVDWQGDRWQLSPAAENFSADQITKLIDNWKLASALQIKSYDGKGGDKITIKLAGTENPLEMLLTAQAPDLVLARPELGIQYHLSDSSAAGLLQLPGMEEEHEMPEQEHPLTDQHNHQH